MMMNQKAMIYIILSAILLYLYYKRGGTAIFMAFVAVVFGTLILGKGRNLEGVRGRRGGSSSSSSSNQCSALKFADPKIDKTRVVTSLIELNNNFKQVCSKYFDVETYNLNKEGGAIVESLFTDDETKGKVETAMKKLETKQNEYFAYMIGASSLLLNKKFEESKKTGKMMFIVFGGEVSVLETLNDFTKEDYKFFKSAVTGAELVLEVINEIKNIDEVKAKGQKTKDFFNFMKCAVEHSIKVMNNLKEALPPYVDPNPKPKSEGDSKGGEEKKKESFEIK
jgi:hypothetical protein